jgi:CHAD domain-containing protein
VAAAEAGRAADRAVALHDARKAAKRVRYLCEVAEPVVGSPAEHLRKRVAGLQELLGEHQDAVVARPALRRLGQAATGQGHNAFTYGVLYAVEHFRAERVERDLPAQLARVRDPRVVAWLDPDR